MEFQGSTLPRSESLFLDERRHDQGDGLDETEVCPTCKGSGCVPRLKLTKQLIKCPCTFSESAISSLLSSQKSIVARLPQMHLPSVKDVVDWEGSCSVLKKKNQCPTSNGKIKNVDETVRRAVMKLSISEWEDKKEGLEECLKIAQDHPDEIELHMNQIYRTMRYLVTNHRPRDTLFVCQIARRYFALLRSTCRPEFDQLVVALLVRTADSSFSVRCHVNDALNKMVTYMPTLYALRPLVEFGCQHRNPLVRTATVRLLSDIVMFRTPSALLTYPVLRESCKRIVESGAKLLVDNSLGTRAAAKHLFLKLVNHAEFDRVYESCSFDRELKKRIDRSISILRNQDVKKI